MFELEKFFGGIVKGSTKKDKKTGQAKKSLLADSLKVSLVIAVAIILIIYFIFKDTIGEDESIFALTFKAGIFVLITIVSGVFLHSKHLEHIYDEKYSDKSSKETVQRGTSKDMDDINVSELSESVGTAGSVGSVASVASTVGQGERNLSGNDKPVQVNVNISSSQMPKSGAFAPPK